MNQKTEEKHLSTQKPRRNLNLNVHNEKSLGSKLFLVSQPYIIH